MTSSIRDFRAASHLPPVSVCLVLAAASLILLCSRTESSGDPKPPDESVSRPARAVALSQSVQVPLVSQEELRIWTWLHQAERQGRDGRPELALATLHRAESLAETTQTAPEVRVAIQRQMAQSLGAAGRHDEAVEVWWRLLSMSPQHEEVARGLASSLYASGRLEEARRVYREILHSEFELADLSAGASMGP